MKKTGWIRQDFWSEGETARDKCMATKISREAGKILNDRELLLEFLIGNARRGTVGEVSGYSGLMSFGGNGNWAVCVDKIALSVQRDFLFGIWRKDAASKKRKYGRIGETDVSKLVSELKKSFTDKEYFMYAGMKLVQETTSAVVASVLEPRIIVFTAANDDGIETGLED
jgi:hypothetical protein